ncbi:protein RADIALIS-like 1 [Nicotiana tabacum]|uniref:Protein RADIALIS-like 1 n=2 Tax=Nicotiana TaxID=4085 RepID=A0A1S3Y6J2_TOBAC|nr:PREDICTED: protein RADIALIS-like 1 [Nicotiana sylvestris]XP_016447542.1 PREDICTED: protein RADIALIS-like 1 [Nicotiana tabacum]
MASNWTTKQNKRFEEALVMYDKGTSSERLQNIAKYVGGKSVEEVRRHYDLLVKDITQIENGQVPLPNYRTTTTAETNARGRYANEQRLLKNLSLQ